MTATAVEPWRDLALCRDHDPTLWDEPTYTELTGGAAALRLTAAAALCGQCPVRAQCEQVARDSVTQSTARANGVWGGLYWRDGRQVPMPKNGRPPTVTPEPEPEPEPVVVVVRCDACEGPTPRRKRGMCDTCYRRAKYGHVARVRVSRCQDCGNTKIQARGYCSTCYQFHRRRGDWSVSA